MSKFEHLIVEERGAVADVTLNRSERLNALNPGMLSELQSFFGGLTVQSSARVVVLRGAGRAFCAGLDLRDIQAGGSRKSVEAYLAVQKSVRDVVLAMRRCPQPIISVVQGAASGGGFALALASDIRLLTPDARLNAAFIRVGLSSCDIGVSYFLPRLVGASVASEFLLTGRFMDASRALSLGLASRVAELSMLNTEASSFAEDMLAATPLGLRMTKDVLTFSVDAPSLEAAIAMEDRTQVLCTQGEDFAEGIAAFLEKRLPRYSSKEAQP